MRFWDSSAVVPLLVREDSTARLRAHFEADRVVAVWWATYVECTSALARRHAMGSLNRASFDQAVARLDRAAVAWSEVPPSDDLRRHAVRIVRRHRLRAADALQLAAALVAADLAPATVDFVTLDTHQAEAAEREGFRVVA